MAVQFALRPRIRLEPAAAPRRRRRALSIHPLVLPVGLYWLALAGVAHAVIEQTRHPAEAVAASEPVAPSVSPPVVVQESAAAGVQAEPSPLPENEPAPLALVPSPPLQEVSTTEEAAPSQATRRNPEHAPAFVAAKEPEPLHRAESRTTARVAPARQALTPPAPPGELASLPAESSQEPPEPRVLRRPDSSDEAPPRTALPSCEAAAESAEETIDVRAPRGAPDLTRGAFANVLENGAYLGRCSIPDRTAIEICAAVRDGKVLGVSVRTEPPSAAISGCVRRAVAALRFPQSARLDITRTRFEAVR